MNSRKEDQVGIIEYLSPHKGFGGIVKMRFQDFLVNEIGEDDEVVHLTDVTCNITYEDTNSETKVENDDQNLGDVLSEEDKDKMAELLNNKDAEPVFIKASGTKEERTKIHKAIRWLYQKLESQTVDGQSPDEKLIKVTKSSGGANRGSSYHRPRMPRKSLCKFVLFKHNVGTMEAINIIAKRLHLFRANGFQYAGTKDKRAVTTQWVTAPVAAERLCGLNKRATNIKVGNFSYCTKPLHIGALNGNHFSIVIRNVTGENTDIETAVETFSNHGFVNYFGLQRFGTGCVPTQKVGIAILKSNWQEVVDLLLSPRAEDDTSDLNKALNEYKNTGDIDATLDLLKYRNSIEGMLLQGIKKFGKTQLLQAFTKIPRNMRKMYVHAYQSFVWNAVTSRRIKEYGTKPIAGDLVLASVYETMTQVTDEPPIKKPCVDESDDKNLEKCDFDVKILTKDDLKLFKIEDILLPLPGHDIRYPENDIKSWYRELMIDDGIDIDTHMVHKLKDFSLPGAYRNIVTRPSRVKHDLVRYDDFKIPLLQNDAERMNNVSASNGCEDGKFLAMRLQFSLPASSYATIALRELMKTDVSFAAQLKLNEEHGACNTEDTTVDDA